MKKRYIVLSGLLAVTLAACSQEKPKNEENTQKTEQTSQPEGTVGSKSQASSQKKAEVVNKGDYYSIQGKYDEIVIANKHYPLSKTIIQEKIQQLKQSWSNSLQQCKQLATQSAITTVVLEVMKPKPNFIKTM